MGNCFSFCHCFPKENTYYDPLCHYYCFICGKYFKSKKDYNLHTIKCNNKRNTLHTPPISHT